jgi:hypothetical protein
VKKIKWTTRKPRMTVEQNIEARIAVNRAKLQAQQKCDELRARLSIDARERIASHRV